MILVVTHHRQGRKLADSGESSGELIACSSDSKLTLCSPKATIAAGEVLYDR